MGMPGILRVAGGRQARGNTLGVEGGLESGRPQGGSGEQYFVGRFDGARFGTTIRRPTTLWTDYGKDCYCALTFNDLPQTQPPVMIGWMSNWQYAAKCPRALARANDHPAGGCN